MTTNSPKGDLLLRIDQVSKHYPTGRALFSGSSQAVRALDGVSLSVRRGETLGIVGESGSGKSTLARLIMGLEPVTSGMITFDGQDVYRSTGRWRLRRRMQMVFQDPYSSLNPRMRAGDIIEEPLRIHGLGDRAERRRRMEELLDLVGLPKSAGRRLPHEFSGGQRQRICVARALALNPDLIVADEPVSALDVSIQAQIINLLEELQREFDLTYVFIAHDLAVVRHIADRVAVLYLGKLMEVGGQEALYNHPLHPYTRALIEAAPIPDPIKERAIEHRPLTGEIPSPLAPPPGCVFHTRCPLASQECHETVPSLRTFAPEHQVACIKV